MRKLIVAEDGVGLGKGLLRRIGHESSVLLQNITIEGDSLHLEGTLSTISLDESLILHFTNGKANYASKITTTKNRKEKTISDDIIRRTKSFKVDITLCGDCEIKAIVVESNGASMPVRFCYDVLSGLTEAINASFCMLGQWLILVRGSQKHLVLKKSPSLYARAKRELVFLKNLFFYKNVQKKHVGKRWIFFRIAYHVMRVFQRKEKWLISDRVNQGSDNGEALYEYLLEKSQKGVNTYFVIDAASPDYERLHNKGVVLKWRSIRHLLMFLLASKLISSSFDEQVINPFGKSNIFVRDLFRWDFIFLQHGITKDDISNFVCKRVRNIKLFICAAYREYDSIIGNDYGYTEKEVKLTGFPRHEKLLKNKGKIQAENLILIAPTWRRYLVNLRKNPEKAASIFSEFSQSSFHSFYNRLLNDTKLLNIMREYNYRAEFVLHPRMAHEIKHFASGELVTIKSTIRYDEAFLKAKILVTDYSSIILDFALLEKAIVRTKFDEEIFYDTHFHKGSAEEAAEIFSLFCPSFQDYNETVDAIIRAIECNGGMAMKYKENVSTFFFRPEESSCKLIIDKIMEIE